MSKCRRPKLKRLVLTVRFLSIAAEQYCTLTSRSATLAAVLGPSLDAYGFGCADVLDRVFLLGNVPQYVMGVNDQRLLFLSDVVSPILMLFSSVSKVAVCMPDLCEGLPQYRQILSE